MLRPGHPPEQHAGPGEVAWRDGVQRVCIQDGVAQVPRLMVHQHRGLQLREEGVTMRWTDSIGKGCVSDECGVKVKIEARQRESRRQSPCPPCQCTAPPLTWRPQAILLHHCRRSERRRPAYPFQRAAVMRWAARLTANLVGRVALWHEAGRRRVQEARNAKSTQMQICNAHACTYAVQQA